jgi:hypothetical protein
MGVGGVGGGVTTVEIGVCGWGKEEFFKELRVYLQDEGSEEGHAETAKRLGTTAGTVAVSMHRLRKRYRHVLRGVVLETVSHPVEVDAELAELLSALRG